MPLVKAKIINLDKSGDDLTVLFNPKEFSIQKTVQWEPHKAPGLDLPEQEFTSGNPRVLAVELFFDTWDTPSFQKADVRKVYTQKIAGLMEIDPQLHTPPLLLISWSSLQFSCVLARVNQKFTMFDTDGKPVRARLTCTFNEVIDPEQESRDVSRQTADFSKVHVVTQGERLIDIANALYNDPKAWRPIAIANALDDPRTIFPGQSLIVPSLPFIDPQTREVVQ